MGQGRRRFEDWHHLLAMCLIMTAAAVGLAYLFLTVNLIPNPGSLERGLIDHFVQVLFAIAGVVFAIVVTVLIYAVLFFRRQPGDDTDGRPLRGELALELSWTIIPLIIVIALSYQGAKILDKMMTVMPGHEGSMTVYSLGAFVPGKTGASGQTSQPELVVNVAASRFVWEFAYPEYGINSVYELEVPVDRRVVLNLASRDVIHSFWVQEWGPTQDAVPGLSPTLRITPTVPGQYTVECSQLCGFGHSAMTAPVRVVSADEFAQWVERQKTSVTPSSPPAGSHVMVDLVAESVSFDKSVITVPAGVHVMINFENKDVGVPHNFAVYKTAKADEEIFSGAMITGPKRITYEFMAPTAPGTYFFRCDAHPDAMTGTLVVK